MIKEAIIQLMAGDDLSSEMTRGVFREIFKEKATLVQIAAFLTALKIKGETYQEIAAAAKVVREKALKIHVASRSHQGSCVEDIFDPVGTGGGGVNTFNISTAVAFVVAAAGIKVAKHGNRAASSQCGSADVLEFMGLRLSVSPQIIEAAIKKVGVGFLYAPRFHPAFKIVAPVRRQIGIKTIFNILGPLSNPAGANVQLLGVFDPDLIAPMVRALKCLEINRVFVVFGSGVRDEVSLMGPTRVAFLKRGRIRNLTWNPSDFGLKKCRLSDVEVKNAKESAGIITAVLRGRKGPPLDIVLANAAAALVVLGIAKDLKAGVRAARELIISGKAKEKFLGLKRFLEEHSEL